MLSLPGCNKKYDQMSFLTRLLLSALLSACKQYGPRSGFIAFTVFAAMIRLDCSLSKVPNFFLDNVYFEKGSRRQQKYEKLPSIQRVKGDSNPNDKYVLSERAL